MNNRNSKSIDGFGLRRTRAVPGRSTRLGVDGLKVPDRFLDKNATHSSSSDITPEQHLPSPGSVKRSELDSALREIDESESPRPAKRSGWRRFVRFPRLTKKRVLITFMVLLILFGGYFAIKLLLASGRIFGGNLFDLLGSGKRLQTDEFGRSNILIFGTSEDDPGHEGADLTDSIMVLSVHQDKKNAYMISVPRDLWVQYGQACSSGYEGKINALYQCYSGGGKNEKAGANALRKKAGDVLGLNVQYYAKVNYSAVRDLVNAVGGVTVKIESDDPRGILDRNFDWKCNYRCHYVKWPNGPAKLNGEQALALARARNAAGGYGLSGGNFDREQYQQKIMVALREKASSAGTLANPIAVNGLIDALGDNVRTSFEAGEIKTLINLAGDIESKNIKSVNLVKEGKAVLTTGSYGGQSIVQPVAGIYDFSGVHAYVRSALNASGISSEEASVVVLNGSDTGGLAGAKALELKRAGFANVTAGDTATRSSYRTIQWYDLSSGTKPKTAAKLSELLGVGSSGASLPSGVQASGDFVIILGNGSN